MRYCSESRMTPNKKPRHLTGLFIILTERKGSVSRFYPAGRLTFWALLRFKLDALPFAQTFEAAALYRRMMHKHVFTAILRSNETESFRIVKPFYRTSTHKYSAIQKTGKTG
ncbi:hypothetical protein BN874_390012 [Candidatus Contendobacter odensis Run_B_J11]|uniref:Uncharacterized protein n=1 Tax=Candidatus Contendobacter odensis Run_B_J11 TaxID=1400861 RepID=A0A7U7J5A9_9GAMM|nr:hypothetical protein BN874_390012 [Candidatus Contendobacter odensis Run_B_J11]